MRVLVLGIGNILIGDEGAGVIFLEYFRKNLAPNIYIKEEFKNQDSHQLVFLDGGTMAMNLAHIIADFDKVYVIDCINADDLEVGDVVFFDYDKVPSNINYQGSAHELEMQMMLNFMSLVGDLPVCKILGIVPKRLEPMKISLSDEVKKSFALIQKCLLEELKQDGFLLEFKNDFSIEQAIENYRNLSSVN
ncbi:MULTISPECIES: HyaD/HybD family hydrogenase maturation endopeptidase [unclassified Campylobacter]|uniref:HyaD/HybD family hydrogenase maturation endopeptidase n=1 Tax=unclassified Campylobacter TaxID=2593542 RepID=UPI001BD98374|nr:MULTISPECIES: HyaD/HybD family hydrogenase maturation endopeptidase [unclassified Campylobacter]MBT0879784.1 HyaD/HybD family hydrogenase maturation endopeptidase [Campylobacter sp. 2018MI27]MBT0885106.1 HyaD/HybD family hydrogenase maturation endopeptidase [Campylobacter sp. 2018MI10]